MAFGLPNISFIGFPVPVPCAAHAGLGFREALPADAPAMVEHLRSLSPEDRRMRFCASVNDAHIVRHVEQSWTRSGLVLAAHDGPLWSGPFHDPGPVRALAEFAVYGRDAELSISVDGALRRRGVGTYLIQTGARLLSQRGVRRIQAYTMSGNTMSGNTAFLVLSRKSGAVIETEAGEAFIDFDVAELTQAYLRRRLAEQVFRAVPRPLVS
jgi:GNAT superfamily N-acetyltransferase